MGNRAPVHRTIQNCPIYFQGVYPNNSARSPNHGWRQWGARLQDEHRKHVGVRCAVRNHEEEEGRQPQQAPHFSNIPCRIPLLLPGSVQAISVLRVCLIVSTCTG